MLYLDTYALMEIYRGNESYLSLLENSYIVCELTLCEYYAVLFREEGEKVAQAWYDKFIPFVQPTPLSVLRDGIMYRMENKVLNLSLFDAIGYQHALSKHGAFVTGDKSFEKLPHVKYVK